MLSVTLHQMRTGWVRLVAAGLAIMLGTGFVAASVLGGQVMQSAAYQSFTSSFAGSDLVVVQNHDAAQPGTFTPQTLEQIAATQGITQVRNLAQIAAVIDTPSGGQWSQIGPLSSHEPGELLSGTFPADETEVAITRETAERLGFEIGQEVTFTILDGDYGQQDPPALRLTITGLLTAPVDLFDFTDSAVITDAAFSSPDLHPATQAGPVGVTLKAGASVQEVADAIEAAIGSGYQIDTVEEIAEERMKGLSGDTNTMRNLLLGFAGVALAVAALVIANTFSVLVAGRTRQLALLRTVGASRGQVRRSVLAEALLLGLVSSLGGVVLGYAVIAGAIGAVSRSVPGINMWKGMTLSPAVILATVLTGLVLTLVSSWSPARAATRVRPLEALRPEPVGVGSTAGKFRATIAALAFLGGTGLLGWAVAMSFTENNTALALAVGILGGFMSVFGVVLGSVFLITPVVGVIGKLFGTGVPAAVATMGAVRNPRRTATTTNALFIGVGLVVMMATGAATAKSTLDHELTENYPIDIQVLAVDTGSGEAALTETQIEAAGSLPNIDVLAPMAHRVVDISGDITVDTFAPAETPVNVPGGGAGEFLTDPSAFAALGEHEALIPEWLAESRGLEVGAKFETYPGSGAPVQLEVAGITKVGDGLITTPATLRALGGEISPRFLWIGLSPQAEPDETLTQLQDALTSAGGPAFSINSPALERDAFGAIIDTLLLIVTAMLAVAVVIALVGVANTLSLSVLERRRESATLRALGLTTGQLRGMLAIEGIIIALVGALAGTVGGLVYGWAGAYTMLGALGTVHPVVPWLTVAGVLAVAVLSGLAASVLPARTAVKVSPVAALAQE